MNASFSETEQGRLVLSCWQQSLWYRVSDLTGRMLYRSRAVIYLPRGVESLKPSWGMPTIVGVWCVFPGGISQAQNITVNFLADLVCLNLMLLLPLRSLVLGIGSCQKIPSLSQCILTICDIHSLGSPKEGVLALEELCSTVAHGWGNSTRNWVLWQWKVMFLLSWLKPIY